MTKAQYGTPEYYRGQLLDIEEELNGSLDGETGSRSYAFAYGRTHALAGFILAQLEQALENARPHCRPGCKYIQGHSGPCIERDLDAEVNAGKWGPPGSGLAEFVESNKVGCANAIDPATWPGEPEFVNVNHE